MFAAKSKNLIGRLLSALFIVIVALFSAGCRQNPTTEPKYYARELDEMKRAESRAAAKNENKYLQDGYPWRDKKVQTCLPCRIKVSEKELAAEIKYLHETVHGKQKSRLRFRD